MEHSIKTSVTKKMPDFAKSHQKLNKQMNERKQNKRPPTKPVEFNLSKPNKQRKVSHEEVKTPNPHQEKLIILSPDEILSRPTNQSSPIIISPLSDTNYNLQEIEHVTSSHSFSFPPLVLTSASHTSTPKSANTLFNSLRLSSDKNLIPTNTSNSYVKILPKPIPIDIYTDYQKN